MVAAILAPVAGERGGDLPTHFLSDHFVQPRELLTDRLAERQITVETLRNAQAIIKTISGGPAPAFSQTSSTAIKKENRFAAKKLFPNDETTVLSLSVNRE